MMKMSREIFDASRNIRLTLFLMLIIGIRLFAVPDSSIYSVSVNYIITSTSGISSSTKNTPQIKNSSDYFLQAIEISNTGLTFTEYHRLLAILILSNKVLSVSYNYSYSIHNPEVFKPFFPVPIFIRGHALLT